MTADQAKKIAELSASAAEADRIVAFHASNMRDARQAEARANEAARISTALYDKWCAQAAVFKTELAMLKATATPADVITFPLPVQS